MHVEDIKISTQKLGDESTVWVAHLPTGLVLSQETTDIEEAQRELVQLIRSTIDQDMLYN